MAHHDHERHWSGALPAMKKLITTPRTVVREMLDGISEADLRDNEQAASQITVQGARYSEGAQRLINR